MYIYIYVIIASCVRVESDRTCPAMSAAVGAGGGMSLVLCLVCCFLLFGAAGGPSPRLENTESKRWRPSSTHEEKKKSIARNARRETVGGSSGGVPGGFQGGFRGGGGGVVDWRPKKKQKQGEYDVESSEDDHRTTQNVLETRAHRRDCDRERDTKVVERK